MRTCDYKYWAAPFAEYNEIQSAAVPHADKDCNIVVSAPTASGKTAIAECVFGYHAARGGGMLYLCPFRALADEKYAAWAKTPLAAGGIAKWTGDEPERKPAGLVVATFESFYTALGNSEMREWVSSLEVAAYDEAHLIGDEHRGSAIEATLMELSERNPGCRLVLLSATMGNAREIAAWVKSLNGKPTKAISAGWRQKRVEMTLEGVGTWRGRVARAAELAVANADVKTIVFVQSKAAGEEIVKKARAAGQRCVFHNASVKPGVRKKMEDAFGDPFSGLNILVSTSTLSAGVNIG